MSKKSIKLGDAFMTTQDTRLFAIVISNVVTFSAGAATLYYQGSSTNVIDTYDVGGTSCVVTGNQITAPPLAITKAGKYNLYFKGTYGSEVGSWYITITVDAPKGP